jgi:Fic family protein
MFDRLIKNDFLDRYKSMLKVDLQAAFSKVETIELSPQNFNFYTSVSVISSSKIEGEQMEIDSYIKHKVLNVEYLPDLTEKPNDLFAAYVFAKNNRLTADSLLKAHAIIAAHLLPEIRRGVLRTTEMLVIDSATGTIEYEAAARNSVHKLMEQFFDEIDILLNNNKLTIIEIFYYASFIHLVFVKIHPFADGNGRTARLLEKWFLAEKLGEKAWFLQSEKFYYDHREAYYHNLAQLGFSFLELNYEQSIPFLLMLAESTDNKYINTNNNL